jgi:hypothetical protein
VELTGVDGERIDALFVLPAVPVPAGGVVGDFLLEPPQPASAIAAALRISARWRACNVLMFLLVIGALARTWMSAAPDLGT